MKITTAYKYFLDHLEIILGSLMILLFTTCYILLILNRYWQYEYFYIDNVFFDSALWKIAHLQAPIVFHQWWGEMNIFADHWHPILIPLSFIYRVFPFQEAILIFSVLVYSLGAIFGFLIGRFFKLHWSLNIGLIFAYFLYLGTQNAFIFGFHEIVFFGWLFLMTAWSYLRVKRKTFIISVLLFLMIKETTAVYLIFLFAGLYFVDRKNWKWLFMGAICALFYYLMSIKVLIPMISGGGYRYAYNDWPNDAIDFWRQMFGTGAKVKTFLVSIFTWGGLALFAPTIYPLIIVEFVMRYLGTIAGNIQDSLYFHYGWTTGPIIYLGSLIGAKNLISLLTKNQSKSKYLEKLFDCQIYQFGFSVVIIMSVLLLHRDALPQRGPLELVMKPAFYETTRDNRFLDELIANVPQTSEAIMTMNHLAYHLTHRAGMVYLMADDNPLRSNKFSNFLPSPDYLVYDLRKDQNPNNFFPDNFESMIAFRTRLLNGGFYKVYWEKGDLLILKKTKEFALPKSTNPVSPNTNETKN